MNVIVYNLLLYLQQNSFQRLVRRMTRFFVKTELQATMKRLGNCLKSENYTYRLNDCSTVSYKLILQNVGIVYYLNQAWLLTI